MRLENDQILENNDWMLPREKFLNKNMYNFYQVGLSNVTWILRNFRRTKREGNVFKHQVVRQAVCDPKTRSAQ